MDLSPLGNASAGRTTRGTGKSVVSEPYVVVARRYRPQSFEQLVGQQHVADVLRKAITTDRVGHAYLFAGARGVGKTSAARILAKALNCQNGPTAVPCDACDICQSVRRGDDMDVLEIDGASNRGIDEIRQLRQNVAVRPSRARLKIYIIDEVHSLTKDAFNALLKTLEEPPGHIKFIFATTEPNKIPLTILSRCQRLDFAEVNEASIAERLLQIAAEEGVCVEPEAMRVLAGQAGGSMRDAQSLLEQLLSVGDERITIDVTRAHLGIAAASRIDHLAVCLVERDTVGALDELDSVLSGSVEVGMLLEQLMGFFRDVLVAAAGCGKEQFLHTVLGQAEGISRMGKKLGTSAGLAVLQILEETISRLRFSMHARILAEMAVVRIASLEDLEQLSSLIVQLRSGAGPSIAVGEKGAGVVVRSRTTEGIDPKKNTSQTATVLPTEGDLATAMVRSPATLPGASATERLTDASARSLWNRVVEQLTEKSEFVADHAAFAESFVVSASDHLVVCFPQKYNSCKVFCERADQQVKLEHTLRQLTGAPVRLQFSLTETDGQQFDQKSGQQAVSRRERTAEIGRRPFVRLAMELFDTGRFQVDSPEN